MTDQDLLYAHRAARICALKARAAGDMAAYHRHGEEVARLNAAIRLRLLERAA